MMITAVGTTGTSAKISGAWRKRIGRNDDGAIAADIRLQDRVAAEQQRPHLGEGERQRGQADQRHHRLTDDPRADRVAREARKHRLPEHQGEQSVDQRRRAIVNAAPPGERDSASCSIAICRPMPSAVP